jgi:sortase A
MTRVQTADPGVPSAASEGTEPAAQAPGPPRERQRRPAASPAALIRQSIGSSILILSACLLGFGLWFTLFSRLHYDHAQQAAYDALRVQLAYGTAPLGPTEPDNSSQLLPLGTPLAVLYIPAIGLQAVVLEGTTGQVLEDGPGHLRDTPLPGQAGISVIMGRRAAYGGPFAKLATLNPGDSITVVTQQTVAKYKVIDLRRGGDPSPPPPSGGQGRLILVTADGAPFAPTGLLYVDAAQTSQAKPDPSALVPASDLAPSENALATDPQAWLPLVLWGQLLLLVTIGLSWLRNAWGRWQAWIIAVPVLGYVVLSISDEVARLLPNLL